MSNNTSSANVPYIGPTGRRSMMKVRLNSTVEELKRLIQEKESISPDLYKLMAAGKVMNNSRPVSEYLVYSTRGYPTLQVVPHARGGKGRSTRKVNRKNRRNTRRNRKN
jgi:hypothetical protein